MIQHRRSAVASTLLAAALLFAACPGGDSGPGGEIIDDTLRVEVKMLDFGRLEVGDTASATLAVRNVAEASVEIEFDIEDAAAADSFSLADRSLVLPAGEEHELTVSFSPNDEGSVSTRLLIRVVETARQVAVELRGEGYFEVEAEHVRISPKAIDFGDVTVGCASRSRETCVRNMGSRPITLSDAFVVSEDEPSPFETTSTTQDLRIDPEASECLTSTFSPPSTGEWSALLELHVGGIDDPFLVTLQGAGVEEEMRVESFDLPRTKADFLFVIDDSASMIEHQQSLMDSLERHVNLLIGMRYDFRVGVITTDAREGSGGMLRPLDGSAPRIITHDLPDPVAALLQNADVGSSGHDVTEGFRSAELLLTGAVEEDEGFIRDEAYLGINFISASPEQSPDSVEHYLGVFRELKGPRRPEQLSASAAVSLDSDCGEGGPHSRYIEATERTGGKLSPICENLWEFADGYWGTGVKSRFMLMQQPVPETIEVFVLLDGTERTDISGLWQYDAETNSITIEPLAFPRPGDVLEVTYQAMCLH